MDRVDRESQPWDAMGSLEFGRPGGRGSVSAGMLVTPLGGHLRGVRACGWACVKVCERGVWESASVV